MFKNILIATCVLSLGGCAAKHQQNTAKVQVESPSVAASPLVQAVDLIEKNNHADAKKILDDFVDTRPADWAHRMANEETVRVYFWDKEQLAECGIFEIVAADGKKMEPVLDASYSKAYYLLAYIAIESRNNPYNNALFNLDKGLALEPDQPTLMYEKAKLFYRTQRPESAVEEYKRLTQTTACLPNPQRARAYRGLGEAFIALAKYDDAEMAFYQSLKFDPDNKKSLEELEYIDKVRNLNIKSASVQ